MINFDKNHDSFFTQGYTPKGKRIYFAQIPEELIAFADENIQTDNAPNDSQSSPLVIYCDFCITKEIQDEIDKSSIIKIKSICNNDTQLILLALPGFSYEKLKEFLNFMIQKFDL